MKKKTAAFTAAFFAATLGLQSFARQAPPMPQTVDEALKADKIKSVIRREPRAPEIIPKGGSECYQAALGAWHKGLRRSAI